MGYSIGIGLLASSFPLLHDNPLLGAGIAVVFAIILGIIIDHLLRWWHKRLGRHDVVRPGKEAAPEEGARAERDAAVDAAPVAVAVVAEVETGR